MTDMTDATEPTEQHSAAASSAFAATAVTNAIANMTDMTAERIFREPVQAGEHVVITAAAFDIAGGLGSGLGLDNVGNGGGGGGGGAYTQGRPVAAIVIGPHGVHVRPIVDLTRIGVTVLMSGLATWRMLRRRR
jgi:uncharacterized spore protein YtfJ